MVELCSCNRVVEGITAFLEDSPPLGTRRWLIGHLHDCPRCARNLHQLRTTVGHLRSIPPEPVPPVTRELLHRAFHSRQSA